MRLHQIKNDCLARLTTLLTCTSLAIANPATAAAIPTTSSATLPSVSGIEIPSHLGKIREVFSSPEQSSKLIIHIQDAHANPGAQQNIDRIIRLLLNRYNIGLIATEGNSGAIDVQTHKKLDQNIRAALADYMVQEGFFNGADSAALKTRNDVTLIGAENNDLYLKNVELFRKLQNDKNLSKAFTSTLLDKLETHVPEQHSVLFKQSAAFHAGMITPQNYADFLAAYVKPSGEYTNYSLNTQINALEDSLDITVLLEEIKSIIPTLMSLQRGEKMKNQIQALATKRRNRTEFLLGLKKLQDEYGVDLEKLFPQHARQLKQMLLKNKLNIQQLGIELIDIEKQAANAQLSPQQQKLFDLIRFATVLKKFPDFNLTPTDLEVFNTLKDQITFNTIKNYLSKNGTPLLPAIIEDSKVFFNNLPLLEEFYEIASKRDTAMVENTLKAMKASGNKAAILLTGGFHTTGIQKQLQSKGVNYILVRPVIDTITDTELYVRLMTGEKNSPDDVFIYRFLALKSKWDSKVLSSLENMLEAFQNEGVLISKQRLEQWLDSAPGRVFARQSDTPGVYEFVPDQTGAVSFGVGDNFLAANVTGQRQLVVKALEKTSAPAIAGDTADVGKSLLDAIKQLGMAVTKTTPEEITTGLAALNTAELEKLTQTLKEGFYFVSDTNTTNAILKNWIAENSTQVHDFIAASKGQLRGDQRYSQKTLLAEINNLAKGLNFRVNMPDGTQRLVVLETQRSMAPADLVNNLVNLTGDTSLGIEAQWNYDLGVKSSNFAAAISQANAKINEIKTSQADDIGKYEQIKTELVSLLNHIGNLDRLKGNIRSKIVSELLDNLDMKTGDLEIDAETNAQIVQAALKIAGQTAQQMTDMHRQFDLLLNSKQVVEGDSISDSGRYRLIENGVMTINPVNWEINGRTGQQTQLAPASLNYIQETSMFMDKATYSMFTAKNTRGDYESDLGAQMALAFERAGKVVDNADTLTEGSILFAATKGSQELVNNARNKGVVVHLVDQLDVENLITFEKVALIASSAGQIKDAFFALSPMVQLMLHSTYGPVLEQILNGQASFKHYGFSTQMSASLVLEMQIKSELAAAIKA